MDALSHSKEISRLYSHVSQETTVRLPVLVDINSWATPIGESWSLLLMRLEAAYWMLKTKTSCLSSLKCFNLKRFVNKYYVSKDCPIHGEL